MNGDKFATRPDEVYGPAVKVFLVVAGASQVVDDQGNATVLRGLRATGAGVVTIKTLDSPTPVAHPVLDGEVIPARITHVTAATGVTGLIGYA